MRFDASGAGLPWVMKVSVESDIRQEFAAIMQARIHIGETRPCFDIGAPGGAKDESGQNCRAILYEMFPDGSALASITELRELYEAPATEVPDSVVCDVLARLYSKNLAEAHVPRYATKRLGAEYRKYLRPDRPDRIPNLFPPDRKTVTLFDQAYPHPTHALREIAARRLPIGIARVVHGDLHPNNVVIAADGDPRLIDFAWSHQRGHILKDYVLMECSLRYLLFPRDVDWATHHHVTKLMAMSDGPGQVLRYLARRRNVVHIDRYRRMALAVEQIRASARQHLQAQFDFDEYLHAQYLVLYGLSKLRDYPVRLVADALGVIALQLL